MDLDSNAKAQIALKRRITPNAKADRDVRARTVRAADSTADLGSRAGACFDRFQQTRW
jgi:hypothetical protein